MAETEEERTPPSQWLAKWVREEKFWQDVTTRTLAALIVVFLGYLYAILAGYVGAPNISRAVLSVVLIVIVVTLIGVYLRLLIWFFTYKSRDKPLARALVFGHGVGAAWIFLLIAMAYGTYQLIQRLWG